MRRIARIFTLAAVASLGAAASARADFYRLDGRFECLGHADAVCFDNSRAPPDPFAAPLPPPASRADPPRARPAAQPVPSSSVPMPETHAAARPPDPILAIAARVEHEHPDPGDLDKLRRAAASGDPRAVELLAWCSLRGIGTGRDPLQAYLLYGKAAALDVPHARENQRLVYERSLTSAQRQRILEVQAAQRPGPGFLTDADETPRHVP